MTREWCADVLAGAFWVIAIVSIYAIAAFGG